jgi:hypothetical protein
MSGSPRKQTFEAGLTTMREIWSSGLQQDQAMSARGSALRQARGQLRRIRPTFVNTALAALMSPRPSTTLADLFTPLLAANPFSTMRASLRR